MPYLLGIDIGTTSTLAATVRPGGGGTDLEVPQLLRLGARGAAVPSVLFLGEDGEVLVGEAAERRILSHPERVVREVKRRVGDTVPLRLGDVSVTPQDLLATQARWVVDRATEREGEAPAAVALAVPATWGAYRTGLVREALAGVGLADVTLVGEPCAAARHYLAQQRIRDGAVVAVYDFGGGTFDAAVVRRTGPGACEILGEPQGLERLGGADLDDLVLGHVAAAVGTGLTDLDPAAPGALSALARLRRECTEAKEALSADAETDVPVLLPDLQTQVRIVRAELEELIAPAVQETAVVLAAALESAKVAPADLEAILLVGGSSRIPLVAQVLSAQFGRPIAIDTDPQASVAFGAALSAAGDAVAPPAIVTPAGIPRDTVDAATPDEAPPRLVSAGSAFVPEPASRPNRRVTGARVAAVAAAVLGITVITSVAGEGPTVIDAGRSTLSDVVAKLGDSVRPEPPAAAAAEQPAAPAQAAPMATDAGVFAGRRAEAEAVSTVRPAKEASPSSTRSEDGTTTEPGATTTGGKGGGGTPSQDAKPGTTAPTRPGTPSSSPTSPSSPSPSPTTDLPTTPSPEPTTPSPEPTTPSPEPTTPSPEPTTPSPEPTTPEPPATQEPSPEPTTPSPEPTTQEPTVEPTSQAPTVEPTTQAPVPPATPDPVPSPTSTLAEPTEPPLVTPTAIEPTAGETLSPTVAGG
ncbi:Hsp70 family protein [Georgenia daeguensis]|uniref:Hsp70 family protein n=1 Tax=Georgenia daeguensis TaxID=908355 RepID=A0ABP8EYM2_9MICO